MCVPWCAPQSPAHRPFKMEWLNVRIAAACHCSGVLQPRDSGHEEAWTTARRRPGWRSKDCRSCTSPAPHRPGGKPSFAIRTISACSSGATSFKANSPPQKGRCSNCFETPPSSSEPLDGRVAKFGRGRTDRCSSLCSTPPRSHARTVPSSPLARKTRRGLGARNSSRKPGRRPCRST